MKSCFLIILCLLLWFGAPLTAAGEQAERPLLTKPFLKLARGVVNMITAPLEVPNQMYILADHADAHSPYGLETAAGAIEGLFNGIGTGLWRFVAGTYDLITFPVPMYESCLIDPTFITVSYAAYYEQSQTASPANDNALSPAISEEVGIPTSENGEKGMHDTPSPGTEPK